MTRADILKYRSQLEFKEQELSRALQQREGIAIEAEADYFDEAQRLTERDLSITKLNRDSLVLREVRLALARIEEGGYGVCVGCQEEIAPRRLNAVPWAQLCLRCQEEADALGEIEPPDFPLAPAA